MLRGPYGVLLTALGYVEDMGALETAVGDLAGDASFVRDSSKIADLIGLNHPNCHHTGSAGLDGACLYSALVQATTPVPTSS